MAPTISASVAVTWVSNSSVSMGGADSFYWRGDRWHLVGEAEEGGVAFLRVSAWFW